MIKKQAKSVKPGCSAMLFIAFWACFSIPGCSLFDRTTTVYGRVTEVAGAGVNSIDVVFIAYKLVGQSMGLMRVTTDKDGNYEGVVEVPKGWGSMGVEIPQGGNPGFTSVYRGYEIYKDGKRVNNCCPAKIGHKTNYDFRVYK